MSSVIGDIYEKHHKISRGANFALFLKERGDLFSAIIGKDKKVVDLGCRDGALTEYYVDGNNVLGVDVDEKSLSVLSDRGINPLNMDLNGIWNIPGSGDYDVVVASEVIEHLYNPRDVLEKINLLLKDGGAVLGSVPNAFRLSCKWRYLFGIKKGTPLEDPTHINHFSLGEFKKLLLDAGFKNIKFYTFPTFRAGFLAKLSPSIFAFMIVFSAEK